MREQINKLIQSNITMYKIAKDTGIPKATIRRIWTGETPIEKVSFGTIEKLVEYYKTNVK